MKPDRIIFLLIFLSGVIGYWPGLFGHYFADDFVFVFITEPLSLVRAFTHYSVGHYAYRPIERFYLILAQHLFGIENPVPHHAFMFLLHAGIGVLILSWMRKKGYSGAASLVAFSFFFLSQSNVLAVASNDTFSQVTSVLAGYGSLMLVLAGNSSGIRKRIWTYLFSVLCFTIALFCKESALGFLPMAAISMVAISFHWLKQKPVRTAALIFLALIPFVAAALLYLSVRSILHYPPAEFGVERTNIGLGFNMVKNLLSLTFNSFLPTSTVDMYFAVTGKAYVKMLLPIILTIAGMVVAGVSLVGKTTRKSAWIVALLVPASLFPVILLNHVSEWYAYSMMPLIAVLFGSGFEIVWRNGRRVRLYLLSICGILAVVNIGAVHAKTSLLQTNGREALVLKQLIQPYLAQVPANGQLVLANPPTSRTTEYSVFKRTGFRLFQTGEMELNRLAGRTDFKTEIICRDSLGYFINDHVLALEYSGIRNIRRIK